MPDASAELERAVADITLTRDARSVLERAAALATARGATIADPVDVLQATLQTRGTRSDQAIRAAGIDPQSIVVAPAGENGAGGPSIPLRQLIVNASREAQVLGHYQVDSIHLLLAMLYTDSRQTSSALLKAGLRLYDVRQHLQTGARPDFLPGESDRAQAERARPERTRQAANARPDAALRRRPLPSLRGAVSVSPVFLAIVAITAVSGAILWFGLLPGLIGAWAIIFVTAGWITSLCIHEFGHALVAYLGGDRAVAASGYLTLNPLRYTNVLLSLILPIVFLLLGGIGLPGGAVYINHTALRSRAWDSAVSVAGPAGTLLCGLLVAVPFMVPGHLGWVTNTNLGFFAALAFLGFIEVIALVLNLLPIPGLDGFGILRPWLPYPVQDLANRYGTFAIIAVFAALFYVAPIQSAFFGFTSQVTTLAGISPELVALGRYLMRLG
jgi:Zn-dependent protease